MLCNDETIILKEQIIKSFKIIAISSKLDFLENSLIIKHPAIIDDIIVPEDFELNETKIGYILNNNSNKRNKSGKVVKITDFLKNRNEAD